MGPGKTGWGEAEKGREGAQGGLGHKPIIVGEERVSLVGAGRGAPGETQALLPLRSAVQPQLNNSDGEGGFTILRKLGNT